MGLVDVKNTLNGLLQGLAKTIYIYSPSTPPPQDDLPCILLGRQNPFVVVRGSTPGTILYEYHFDLKYLFSAVGQNIASEIEQKTEEAIDVTVVRLFQTLTLAPTGIYWNKDDGSATISMGYFDIGSETYFGFSLNLVVFEEAPVFVEPPL